MKVSTIRQQLVDIIYEINPRDANFDNLPFDGDERLIARQKIYRINDDIVFRLNNGFRIYVKMNWM